MQSSFTITSAADLATDIKLIDQTGTDAAINTAHTFTFDLANGASIATLGTQLDAINLNAGSSLTILGNGDTLSGAGKYNGFFVYAGTVAIDNLTIAGARAVGGAGGVSGGGGGAGLGGGLFVTGTSDGVGGASVTLDNVIFNGDSATGGAGGATGIGGGGGGLDGGAGGGVYATNGGGGGIGLSASGGASGEAGGAGIVQGATSGGAGHTQGNAGGAGGKSGGGGGAGTVGEDGGGGGGVGGAVGGDTGPNGTENAGGNGGFGGGGGAGYGPSSLGVGGVGGFGGGGGSGYYFGATGGFGGGGGGSAFLYAAAGGFGAGNGGVEDGGGGGGLGAGGDVFVQQGGTLSIMGGSLGAGIVAGGTASADGDGTAGQAVGSGLFIQGSQSVTLAALGGQTLDVAGVIADEAGSSPYYSADAGTLVIGGAGTVQLDATNTFAGGIVLESGALVLNAPGAAGSGPITLAGTTDLLVLVGTTAVPANEIDNFVYGDTIEITGFIATGSSYSDPTLTLTNSSSVQVTLNIPDVVSGKDFVVSTSGGTTYITAAVPVAPTITPVAPMTVEQGQTTEIATVAPGIAGDPLSLVQIGGSGTVSLQLIGGTYEVLYTAPEPVSPSFTDTVTYTITDENNAGTANGNGAVQIDAGPTINVTVANFGGATSAAYPQFGLIADSAGNLFGTTQNDGANGDGTVFEIVKTNGTYAGTPTVLASFDYNGTTGGEYPYAGLTADSAGDLFGTTEYGGTNDAGTVFEIVKTNGTFASAPTYLASLDDTSGTDPQAGLLIDSNGDLFGTTTYGGKDSAGTVFEIGKANGTYASTPTVIATFDSTKSGGTPYAALIADTAGNLFGTAYDGGSHGDGTVFEIVKTNGTFAGKPTVLATFDGGNGANPQGGLIEDSNGDLFGTTEYGGSDDVGTVFELVNNAGSYTLKTLAKFDGADGAYPYSGLTVDANGDLFGTASGGGPDGFGTVFEIAKINGTYASTPITVFSFSGGNGAYPEAGLLADSNGDLFSTTSEGGGGGFGTVFELTGVAATLTRGQTAVVGSVTPGLAGDTLTLKQAAGSEGTLSLGPVQGNGTRSIIYTAPGTVTAGATDAVHYEITDQHHDAGAFGTASIALEPGVSNGPTLVPFLKDLGVTKDVALDIAMYTDPVPLASGNPVIVTPPSRGTLDASHGRVTYTETLNPTLDRFSFELTDKNGASSPIETGIIGAGGTYTITGAASGYTVVDTGGGPSTFALFGAHNVVRFGHNKNTVTDATATGGDNTVIGSTGPTVVSLTGSGGHNSVALGSGNDTITAGGLDNTITLGRGKDVVNGGTGDTISFTGSTKLTLSGQNETVFIGPGGGSVSDHGTGTVIGVGPTASGLESIFHFSADLATGVIDLLGGVGGITTAAQAYAALTSDGKGGSMLPLGGGLTIDISGVSKPMLSAANFRIG
ncbi:MAG TPA: choice-of-anchor tandem repeat GloVer-containing protein [Acidisphaera sp.]|nr:choice-of-anchor tandem repeat GloVer-containing protein [Acidisphaera sp.]